MSPIALPSKKEGRAIAAEIRAAVPGLDPCRGKGSNKLYGPAELADQVRAELQARPGLIYIYFVDPRCEKLNATIVTR
ncbi:hypothetical protein [Pseudonocardia sp. T1-2H]|uniref:hypothetical protein n=1 Tax=Pseudonocardia sp. T1-2H TaxID=3128899 RepID=UPI003100CEE7